MVVITYQGQHKFKVTLSSLSPMALQRKAANYIKTLKIILFSITVFIKKSGIRDGNLSLHHTLTFIFKYQRRVT